LEYGGRVGWRLSREYVKGVVTERRTRGSPGGGDANETRSARHRVEQGGVLTGVRPAARSRASKASTANRRSRSSSTGRQPSSLCFEPVLRRPQYCYSAAR